MVGICATSIAFLALSFVVVGEKEKWLAIGVTIIGTTILATTIGTLCYWVILNRISLQTRGVFKGILVLVD